MVSEGMDYQGSTSCLPSFFVSRFVEVTNLYMKTDPPIILSVLSLGSNLIIIACTTFVSLCDIDLHYALANLTICKSQYPHIAVERPVL